MAEKFVYMGTDNAISIKDGIVRSTSGVGAKNGATVAAVEYGNGVIHKTILTCTATPITMGDEAGVGQWGGTKVYDFPAGLILSLGAIIDGSVTSPVHDHADGGLIATYDGDVALGEAAPTDHAAGISGTVLQSTAITQAVAQVANVDAISVATDLTESGARWMNGTSTAIDLYLNMLVDDSANNDACTVTFTGAIEIVWINIGDK